MDQDNCIKFSAYSYMPDCHINSPEWTLKALKEITMKSAIVLAVICLSVGLIGCVKAVPVPTSSVVPAATGTTKVSKDANGNTKIEFKVEHLAHPKSLQTPASVYVVWIETPEGQKFNLGQLIVDKNLNGEINAITPFTSFRLIVTAEEFATSTQPGQQIILTTDTLSAK